MAREETTFLKRNDSACTLSVLDRLCLVCPLPDCFPIRSGCLHRSENRTRGVELIKNGTPDGKEDR